MEKQMSLDLGAALSLLAIAGFVMKRGHFLKLMNTDATHSMIRVPVAAALFYGSRSDMATTRNVLLGTGILYMLIGSAGLIDRRLGGVLPSGLTKFDYPYHFVVGAAAIWMGVRSGRMMKSSS